MKQAKALAAGLLAALMLLATGCDFLAEKTDELKSQVDELKAQYEALQEQYGQMKDLLAGEEAAGNPPPLGAQASLASIEAELATYASILETDPADYYDAEGLDDIMADMQATGTTMDDVLRQVQEGWDAFPEVDTSGSKVAQLMDEMNEIVQKITLKISPGLSESWTQQFIAVSSDFATYGQQIADNYSIVIDGAPGNAELLENLEDLKARMQALLEQM